MTKVVYSVTGRPVDLSEATTETLAEVVDEMNGEISSLQEARQLVMLELARRMEGKARQSIEGWKLSNRPFVSVSRRLDYE